MVLFLPAVLADAWLASRPLGAHRSMLRVLTVAIPCVLLAVHLGRYKVEVPDTAQIAYYNAKLSDSKITEDAIEPMHLGVSDNLRVMVGYFHEAKYLRTFVATAVVVVPLALFYLWIVNSILIDAGVTLFARLAFVTAGVAPMALNIVAWD